MAMKKRPPSQDDFEREMRSRRANANPAPAPDQAPPQPQPLTRAARGDRDAYIRSGQQAWERVKKDATYNDWLAIGEALEIGRADAMADAKTNKPEGARYNKLFGEWLASYGFNDIDKAVRSKLFDILANRAAIDAWRADLPVSERLRYNSPSAVWRRWQASLETKPATDSGKSARAKAQFGALKDAKAKIDFTAHIAELEAARSEASDGDIVERAMRLVDEMTEEQHKQFFARLFPLPRQGKPHPPAKKAAAHPKLTWTSGVGGNNDDVAQHGNGEYRVRTTTPLVIGGPQPNTTACAEYIIDRIGRLPAIQNLSPNDLERWLKENVIALGDFKTRAQAMKRCEQDAQTRKSVQP
jgi:hypothetical protein